MRTPIKLLLVSLGFTLMTSCQKDSIIEQNVHADLNNAKGGGVAINNLKIGDTYQGGKIAYILKIGDPGYIKNKVKGIISATEDQTINTTSGYYPGETGCMWQNGTYSFQQQTTYFDVTGAIETTLGSGKANTAKILDIQTKVGKPFPAVNFAVNYRGGGYSDWVLPSRDELYKLYLSKNLIGGFSNGWYWSSTEKNDWYADAIYFETGNIDGGYKGPGATPYKVRAIRYF